MDLKMELFYLRLPPSSDLGKIYLEALFVIETRAATNSAIDVAELVATLFIREFSHLVPDITVKDVFRIDSVAHLPYWFDMLSEFSYGILTLHDTYAAIRARTDHPNIPYFYIIVINSVGNFLLIKLKFRSLIDLTVLHFLRKL